ncbi:Uncharacterised protein [Escherichia coli]|uniref:Uncharacterized protein n=1 Tax=Escherichia coli TaxID=562 RepID=A0A2X3KJ88_ECOLX|nr:Uncharacterised protein [Escherichia coli]
MSFLKYLLFIYENDFLREKIGSSKKQNEFSRTLF